jgi:hypothetical protein
VPGAQAKIVALGDSTTSGVGGAATDFRQSLSYPAQPSTASPPSPTTSSAGDCSRMAASPCSATRSGPARRRPAGR